MLPIPAIDMKEGKAVRLKQGKMNEATVFTTPLEAALDFAEQGATRLHLVDLDGAFAGSPKNAEAVKQILTHLPHLSVQIGGGIRDEQTLCRYLDLGVTYCIIGSKAATHPDEVAALAQKYSQRLILGLDAKNGMIATDGWATETQLSAIELAQVFDEKDIAAIIYTDIAKDGMMGGVNIEQTTALAAATGIPVIASGGVASLADIRAVKTAQPALAGVIIGRALYEGAFTLTEALKEAGISA